MGKSVWVAVVVAVGSCQAPESFRARFDAGTTMGVVVTSGGAGTGGLPITTGEAGTAGPSGGTAGTGIPGTAGSDGATGASGAGGGAGAVVTGVAGTGPGMGGAGGVAGGGGTGTTGGAGAGAGTSGMSVDAGAGAGRGVSDAGRSTVDAATQAPPSVAYASTGWKPTASITAAGSADLPPNAFDGKIATRWTTGRNQTGDETFTVDLGQVASVSRVVLDDTTHAQDFPAAFTIEVSTDGKTFTPVKTGHGATMTDVAFPRVTARYVRIRQTGTTPANGSWWSIDELKIYS